ncbi:sulfatase-like hydrolase/transferase [uncultured Campylobacter sp.]|uniref:sulfatase-like hydrolase/transferase n=1 Tax=uncultured Campylobacter sp. TaxID=218934 RepID=UPI00260CF378|nr:sulfatase-like hydrolase/transferase [uncultured Campylobacter sp.]
MLTCSMLLFLIYHLRLKILQNTLLAILTLLTFALFVVDVFLIYNFKSNLSSYLLSVAIDSSRRESLEFLHNYMSFELIFIYLALICLFIFIFVKLKSFKPNKKIVNSLFVFFLFSMILIHAFKLRPVDERWSDLLYNAYASYNKALVSLASLKEAQGLGANFDEIAKDFSSKINAINDEEKIKNIVLVIGESAQRNYMQIYGYDLNSTPKLSQRLSKEPENTFVFKDVISSYVTTHKSLSQVLTFANQDNKQEWHKSFNVMDFFNIISYDTYVLSNQESYGFFSVSITSILSRALNPIFLNKTDKFDNVSLDEVILKNLTKLKKDKASFYAFHLLGSHATYYKRYPKEFDVFSANSINGAL